MNSQDPQAAMQALAEQLANLLASTTVKADQVQCEECGGNGAGGDHEDDCSQAPSLPAAGSADQPYPEGIAEDLERSDWTPIEALQWYATGKHFDVVGGRTRIIDTGAVASNALKHASLAYLELKGDAELSELRAALSAQQSAHVSVPRELLERVESHLDRTTFAPFGEPLPPDNTERRELRDNIRALLNGGEA